jgi:hypothetical protein
MKKLFILMFIVFSSILLVGCKNEGEGSFGSVRPFAKFPVEIYEDFASYVAFGKVYVDNKDFRTKYDPINDIYYDVIDVNPYIAAEDLEYLNEPTNSGAYSKNEILDIGLLTVEQQSKFIEFSNTFNGKDYLYNITIGKDFENKDIIIIRNQVYFITKKAFEFYTKQTIVFPLETTSSKEIIDCALLASGLDEITLDNLNWDIGGISIHHFEKVDNNSKITFYLLEFSGRISWFDITI